MSKSKFRERLYTMPEVPGFISAADLAELWDVSVSHIHLLVTEKRLKPHRLGSQLAFPLGVAYPDPIVPIAREATKRKVKRDADMARKVKA